MLPPVPRGISTNDRSLFSNSRNFSYKIAYNYQNVDRYLFVKLWIHELMKVAV